jgi:hypothetical protein
MELYPLHWRRVQVHRFNFKILDLKRKTSYGVGLERVSASGEIIETPQDGTLPKR